MIKLRPVEGEEVERIKEHFRKARKVELKLGMRVKLHDGVYVSMDRRGRRIRIEVE